MTRFFPDDWECKQEVDMYLIRSKNTDRVIAWVEGTDEEALLNALMITAAPKIYESIIDLLTETNNIFVEIVEAKVLVTKNINNMMDKYYEKWYKAHEDLNQIQRRGN